MPLILFVAIVNEIMFWLNKKRYFIVIYKCNKWKDELTSWNWKITDWRFINEVSFANEFNKRQGKENILIINILELNKKDYFEYIDWNIYIN